MSEWPRVPYVGVGCIVVREGRLLLMRRANEHGKGSWSTPGGHLDFGESPAECAAREALEETGVRVSNVRFVAITNDVFEEAGRHYITVWMRGETDDSESVTDSDEVAEIGWFRIDELPAPLFRSMANLVAGKTMPAVAPHLAWMGL